MVEEKTNEYSKDEIIAGIRMLFNNVMIELDEVPKVSQGGLHVPGSVVSPYGSVIPTIRSLTGTIVATGDEADEYVRIGDRVLLSDANYVALKGIPGFGRANRLVVATVGALICKIGFDAVTI